MSPFSFSGQENCTKQSDRGANISSYYDTYRLLQVTLQSEEISSDDNDDKEFIDDIIQCLRLNMI